MIVSLSSNLSLTNARWHLEPVDDALVQSLQKGLRLSSVAARCLALRGIQEPAEAETFFRPHLDALHDPYEMLGMATAVERLQQAVRDREKIRVVTDYDVDGTTSSLILQGTLGLLGAQDQLSYHIPDRFDEGYGFSLQAAERAAEDGIDLIVTADIGIRDHDSISKARELGMDVIVCDHHLPEGAAVPQDATTILCPPQPDCHYPNPALAACGVSLKLAQALLKGHPKEHAILMSLLKLAAIGTVADIVDLNTPENRSIVAIGLEQLNRGPHHPGLQALLDVAQVEKGRISAMDIGFRIGPRINAAGRIDSATAVVELLSTRDRSRAREQAEFLDQLNQERRGLQGRMTTRARRQLPPNEQDLPPFLIFADKEGEDWHRGVSGIVASKLRDQYYRPTAVVAIQDGVGVASVRSTPEYHAAELLDACSDLLLRNGGHRAAAGFSIQEENLRELWERLCELCLDATDGQLPERSHRADAQLESRELNRKTLDELQALAPHGKGNPEPRLWVRNVTFQESRILKERHLKGRLQGAPVDVLWWNAAEQQEAFDSGHPMDLLGRLGLNVWKGRETLQFTVDDARYSAK